MSIKKYEVLLQTADLGSFTKASEVLGYTQSAISHIVTGLEDELGLKLLTRDRFGVRLTPEGEALLPAILGGRPMEAPAAVRAPVQTRGLPVAVLGVVLLMEEGAFVVALADALHPDDGAVGPDPVPLGEGEGAAAGAEIVGVEVVDLAAVLAFHSPHGTILSLALGAVTGSVCSLRTV